MKVVLKQKIFGYQAVIFSAIVYGSTPLIASYIYSFGCSPSTLSFLRALLACPFLLFIARTQFCEKTQIRQAAMLGSIAGVIDGITTLTLYTSYSHLPTSMVTTLHFVYPVFVTLGSVFVFKSKLSKVQSLCTALCIVGIFLSFSHQGGGSALGWFLAIFSGLSNAVYMLCVAKMDVSAQAGGYFTFFTMLSSACAVGAYSLLSGELAFPVGFGAWGAILAFAVGSGCLVVTVYQRGIRLIGAQDAAILSTFEPITSTFIGVLILSETINFRTGLGCVMILSAVIILSLSEKRAAAKAIDR